VVTQPWFAGSKGARLLVQRNSAAEVEEISTETEADLYSYELDTVARFCGQGSAPAMSPEDTLGNMRVLDQWRSEAGVAYQAEERDNMIHPLWGPPLARRPDARIVTGRIPGLGKPVARLVMGGMCAETVAGQIILDDYFERGGNAFDTARIYARGEADKSLGHWLQTRGVRDESVVIAKGAITPNCYPEALDRELDESLDDLGLDYADIYIMHRDNLEVPVGEFVDALNGHLRAGRIRAFGGSNWSIARIVEANAYATAHGLVGFGILNNNLSLARMVDPVWEGCLSVGDAASRAWLEEHQFPHLAWSSQAQGFFTPRARDEDRSDANLVRCWYSGDNFERKRRAAELAAERGFEEINVALAYVLSQPFPSWALIGPRSTGEARSCFRALDLTLTADELAWLNLESPAR